MTQLTPQSQRVLERATNDYAFGGSESISIIRELLLLVESQREALDWYAKRSQSLEYSDHSGRWHKIDTTSAFTHRAAEALAHADEVMRKLGEG